jgi:hypothetical protein
MPSYGSIADLYTYSAFCDSFINLQYVNSSAIRILTIYSIVLIPLTSQRILKILQYSANTSKRIVNNGQQYETFNDLQPVTGTRKRILDWLPVQHWANISV